jgi:hypothetical protein
MPFFQNKSNFKLLIVGLVFIFFIALFVLDKIQQNSYNEPVVEQSNEETKEVHDCRDIDGRDKLTGEPTRLNICYVGKFARVKLYRSGVLQLDYVCEHNASMNTCEPVVIHFATPEILKRIQGGERAKEEHESS